MNVLVFFRRPLVPGFCPSIGEVASSTTGTAAAGPGCAMEKVLIFREGA